MHDPDRPGNVDGPTRTADVPHDAGTISTRPAYGPEGTLRHDPDKPTQSHPLGPTGAFSAPPGYEILGELGRGAMGVVYSARQVALNRTVALKMVLAGEHAEPRELVRFLAEAEAVAAIDHRNVVRVHEFGQYNGRPFLSMEAVPGGTLADRIYRAKGGSGPIPPAEAAALIEQVARGVHAAHEVGIVHRDLKPGNILLSADGTPKVADFGLAKRQTGSDLTNTGAILGTPAYMAPEQARGQTKYVGPQADVHALGAVLFACLTGRPPFDEPDAVAVIMKVANQDAPSLRRVAAWVPKDLSIICAKCLAKDPKDRYSTAAALADDLRRFLDGKPILARRSGAIDQLWRWSRRNPGVATLFSAVAALLVVISVGATVAAVQYEAKRTAAESAEKRAVRAETDRRVQLHETELNQAREKRASAGVGQRLNSLRAIRSINDVRAGGERPAGELARLREEAVAALSTIDLKPLGPATPLPPYGIFEVDVSPDLRRYACEDAGSGGTVIRSFDGSSSPVRCPPPPGSGTILRRFSPDGSKLLLLHAQPVPGYDPKPDKLQVVSTATGKDVINKDWAGNGFTIRFLPAGDRLIANDADGSIVVLDFEGRVARSPSRYRVNQFAVHPDGRRVAVAEHDRPIQVLEIETWKPLDTIPLTNATALEWSPNGMWLAVGLPTGGVVVRNYLDKFQFTVPSRHLGPVIGLHFLADDRTLASWSADGESQLWQWAANRMLLRVPGRILGIEPLTDRLAVATDRDLQLFETVDGGEYRVLGTAATAASPSPDGRFLVVSDGTAGVSLWDAVTSQWLTTLGLDSCGPVRFRPGGQEFATFGEYSRLNRWPYRYTDDGRLLVGPPAGMPFTRPRVRLGVGDEFIRTVTQIAIEEPRHLGRSVAWTAGGSRLLVCDFKDWRLALTEQSASIAREVVTDFKDPICVAASPDGGYYAAGRFRFSESGVWRAVDGRRVLTAPGCRSVAFSADGRYFATAGAETCQIYRVGQWDKPLVSVPLVVRLAEVDGPPLAFRDDGRALAVPFSPETVGLIDPETGSVLLTVPMPFTGAVADLAFSPDGGKLIVTLPYRNVHVWDLRRIGAALTELGLGLPTDLPASDGPQTTRITGVTVNRGSLPPAVTGWTATLLKMAYYEYLLGKFSDAVEASTRAVNLLENHRQTTPLGEALFARSKYYLANGEPGPARDDLVAADRNLSDRPDVRLVLVRLVVLGPESVRDAGLALNLLTGLGAGEPALLRAAALVRLNAATEAASALDAIPEDNRGGVWYYLKTLHEARTGGPAVAKPWLDRATTAYEKAAKRTDDRMKLDELKRLKAEAESAVGR